MRRIRIFFVLIILLVFISTSAVFLSSLATTSGNSIAASSPTPFVPPPEPIHYREVPILMYHVIEDFNGPLEQLYVSPLEFRKQMEFLQKHNFHTVPVCDVLNHWKYGQALPANPIVLSFDDGYRSIYTQAFPILKEYGFIGTLYLCTNKIDTESGLTTEMIKEMSLHGFEIGSHTVSHPDLTKINTARLSQEIKDSKSVLESLVGQEVSTFCYPSGQSNLSVREEVQEAGYLGAVTTRYGYASADQNSYLLNRIRVNKKDSLQAFQKKLEYFH